MKTHALYRKLKLLEKLTIFKEISYRISDALSYGRRAATSCEIYRPDRKPTIREQFGPARPV